MSQEIRTAATERSTTIEVSTPQRSPLAWLTPGRVALLTSLLSSLLYLATMNRTYGFVDKGELVAVASTAGIPHPTGYPTIMLLGYLFTLIMPMRDVLALNVMSALLTGAGAGMLALLFYDLIGRVAARDTTTRGRKRDGRIDAKKEKKRRKDEGSIPAQSLPPGITGAIAGLAALFTATTATWWNQGNGFEVYSLHALLMPLIALLFLRYVDEEKERDDAGFTRRGALFAFALGLAFTNHLSTILLAPAFLLYFIWTLGFNAGSLKRVLYLAPPFLLGLLPYAWLPIRAAMRPRFNWGNPQTWPDFIDHISGKVYQVWMFDNATVFEQQTAFFFSHLPGEVAYVGLVPAALGIFLLARRSVKLAVWSGLLFVTCVLYSGNYDIMEIGPYYMTAIFAVGIWCAMGMVWLQERLGANGALGLAAALVVANVAINYAASDESGNTLVEDMTVNVLQPLPANAVVFSAQWDFWVAGSFYMQGVENLRPDVIVIDPELVRRRWYIDQLTNTYPELMGPVKAEAEHFKREVIKFDRDEPYDANVLQAAYIGLMNAIIEKHIARRPIFVGGEVDAAIGAKYIRTPSNLMLRLAADSTYIPQPFPNYRFKFWEGRIDNYTAKTYELYARAAFIRSLYESHHGRDSLAARYRDLALSYDPGFTVADIPDLPLNSEEQVMGMIGLFGQIRERGF